jgi:hypothetical protein
MTLPSHSDSIERWSHQVGRTLTTTMLVISQRTFVRAIALVGRPFAST